MNIEQPTNQEEPKYTLEQLESDIEQSHQRLIGYLQALVDSKNLDEFERLCPESAKRMRERGEESFNFNKEGAPAILEIVSGQSEPQRFFGFTNNFIGYLPGDIYAKIDSSEMKKKCKDVEEIIKNMGLDPGEMAKWDHKYSNWSEEESRERWQIIKRIYVEMINRGYTNQDLRG